jgi:hypothetical protein
MKNTNNSRNELKLPIKIKKSVFHLIRTLFAVSLILLVFELALPDVVCWFISRDPMDMFPLLLFIGALVACIGGYIYVFPKHILFKKFEIKLYYSFNRNKTLFYSQFNCYVIDDMLQIITLKFKDSKKQIEFYYPPADLERLVKLFDLNKIEKYDFSKEKKKKK